MATMPKLNINFRSAGATALARGERGVILLVLRQSAAVSGNPVTVLTTEDIPTAATAANKTYIKLALLGNETAPRKVVCYFIGTEDDLTAPFTWAQTNKADYFVMPTVATDELTGTVKDWILAQKAQNNMIKAILPNTAADSEYIINYATDSVSVGNVSYTAEQFAVRIAGIICGTSLTHSVTYATVPEATDCTRKTAAEMDAAVNAGQLFCFFDGEKVKLSRGVNSLTTTTAEKNEEFTKIKHVEVIDLIKNDVRIFCQDSYIGKFANSYVNRCLLLSALEIYFDGLAADGLISSAEVSFDTEAIKGAMRTAGIDFADMSDEEIVQYDFGTHVFLAVRLRLLDAIEDIDINITV